MNLGAPEIIIVLLVVVLLFGGAKLPKLARSLGSAKGEFEKGLKDGEKASKDEAAKPAEPKAVEAAPEASTTSAVPEADASEPVAETTTTKGDTPA